METNLSFNKEKNITFKLANMETIEEFCMWKAWGKQNMTIVDPQGNEYQFPIKSGQLTGKDGVVRDVLTDIKYMKKGIFEMQYPDFSKKTSIVREIIINGEHWKYRFSMTANNRLQQLITTVKNLGQDPLVQTYSQTYDKMQLPVNKYDVRIVTSFQQPQPQQQQQQPVQVPQVQQPTQTQQPQQQPTPTLAEIERNMIDIPGQPKQIRSTVQQGQTPEQIAAILQKQPQVNVPTAQPTQLTEQEKQIIDSCNSLSVKLNETNFKLICEKNNILEERGKYLYNLVTNK